MFSRVLLLAVLLLSPGAFAADGAATARRALEQERTEAAALRERQHALRLELNAVGDRIARLKEASRGTLLRQDELDAELKRSQELSRQLTELSAQVAERDAAASRAQRALVEALTQELTALRAQFEKSEDRSARRALIAQMRTVREERERHEAALPRSGTTTLSTAASDDPEELLEQADALRDSRDKVNKRLAAVRRRVHELRQEQELDRRMQEFVDDESLFDEHDRRIGRQASTPAGEAADFDGPAIPVGLSGGPRAQTGGTSPSPDRFRDPQSELGAPAPDDLRGLEAEAQRLEAAAAELELRAKDAERRALDLHPRAQ